MSDTTPLSDTAATPDHEPAEQTAEPTAETVPATTGRRWPELSDLGELFDWFRGRDERRWRLFEDRLGLEPMRIEEETVDNVLHIRAEVPGIDPATDADVSIHDGQLRIKVERRREAKTTEHGGFRSEFRYGSLYRSVPIDRSVDPDTITASYRDGVLDVAVPLPDRADAARKVEVTRG